MKTVTFNQIRDAVAELCQRANFELTGDVRRALAAGVEAETRPLAKNTLLRILENADIAASNRLPMCQDTGLAVFFVDVGQDVHIEGGLLVDAGDRYVLDRPVPPLAIPTMLHDSLMARLDRLGPAKRVAQLAACLGREFGHEMLAAVADQDDGRLGAALDASRPPSPGIERGRSRDPGRCSSGAAACCRLDRPGAHRGSWRRGPGTARNFE